MKIFTCIFIITFILSGCVPKSKYKENNDVLNLENSKSNFKQIKDTKEDNHSNDNPVDGSGNTYNTVVIGKQVWLKENLKTSKYNDGTEINKIIDLDLWTHINSDGYRECDANSDNGFIYNYFVIIAGKQVCPAGYHVPTINEWNEMLNYLGGENVAGSKLKTIGSNHWTKDNNSTNESDFSAKSNCFITVSGDLYFNNLSGPYLKLWTSTKKNIDKAFTISISSLEDKVDIQNKDINSGQSIRCIKNR